MLLSLTRQTSNVSSRSSPTFTSNLPQAFIPLLLNGTRQTRATRLCRHSFLTSWRRSRILSSAPSSVITNNDWFRWGRAPPVLMRWNRSTRILFDLLPPNLLYMLPSLRETTMYWLIPYGLLWRAVSILWGFLFDGLRLSSQAWLRWRATFLS